MSVVYGEPGPYDGVSLSLEPVTDGTPRVRIVLENAPAVTVTVQRSCEGETQIVAGARNVPVTAAAVFTDWAAPLNRTTVYTVLDSSGDSVVSGAVVLPSDAAYIQDPLRPDNAIPVLTDGRRPGYLTMRSGALKNVDYQVQATELQVMGAKYSRVLGGQRKAASGVDVSSASYDRQVDTAFRNMIAETPILLLRTTSDMHPLPPVCYILADVAEQPVTVHIGGTLSRWQITGNLVAAVIQAVLTGQITYGQVQELLGGYTYGEVQAAASNTTYLDWQKDPLIFSTL